MHSFVFYKKHREKNSQNNVSGMYAYALHYNANRCSYWGVNRPGHCNEVFSTFLRQNAEKEHWARLLHLEHFHKIQHR